MSEKIWVVEPKDRDAVRRLAEAAGVSTITAQILLNRGIADPRAARRFLQPALDHLHDPFTFTLMRAAADRITRGIREKEKIAVFGDYDVDGISALTILVRYLRLVGSDPLFTVPHRIRDGYGLNEGAIRKFAEGGATLLITLDCGTNDHELISLAKSIGMEVVVVDHHEPSNGLPPAVAVINPKCPENSYPFTGLCSGALSFKLTWALAETLPASLKQTERYRNFLLDAFSFVTLSTFADISPMIDENRTLIRFGVDALQHAPNPGLHRLLKRVRLLGKSVTEFDIGFRIAPLLNALGRMGESMDAARLFLSDDPTEIETILDRAENANRERQRTDSAIFAEASRQFDKRADAPAVVLANEDWHLGVVGIVAARLVDKYNRPAAVLAVEGETAKGSLRTTNGFDLAAAIQTCAAQIPGVKGGGHAQAAGVTVPKKQIKAFRDLFESLVGEAQSERKPATLRIDDEVTIGQIGPQLCREMDRLSPHGQGNPRPLLACRGLTPTGEPRIMKERHVAFQVTDGQRSIRAVAFNRPRLGGQLKKWGRIDVAFSPRVNEEWSRLPELIVEDVRESAA